MVASNIKVYIRVRPCKKPSPGFQANVETGGVTFEQPKNTPDREVNNTKTTHGFRFDGVLGMPIQQQDVLDTVAKPVIDDVLSGVNGTIFAYGQTGSGKTFTITGSPERYEDRGLIPRTLDYMFDTFKKGGSQFRMYISYLEIYNNAGYDLLRDDSTGKLEDLPKVILREDEDGATHLRNLSVNLAATKEDALNLLFMGDTNRVVAETPMNDASTRSHCLFIIWIDSTQPGSDVVRRSKLHLVDLAGSERVSRTGVEGTLLTEATQINLSLHYLEQVIVALHDRAKGGRGHVPYRNSMMTSVLRDSLGGNCKTTMIGCIAAEPSNIDESIATCRFAQRVAQITNNARVNEELDPNLLIARLRRELTELKEEVKVARGGQDGGPDNFTPEDVEKCRALVLQYVSKNADPKEPFVCGSVERLRTSFRILRDLCQGASSEFVGAGANSAATGGSSVGNARKAALEEEAQKLRLEVAQRDQEIGVLMQMLSKQRGGDSRPFISGGASGSLVSAVTASSASRQTAHNKTLEAGTAGPTNVTATTEDTMRSAALATFAAEPRAAPASGEGVERKPAAPARRVPGMPAVPPKVSLPSGVDAADLLLDRAKAFEVFRSSRNEPESRDMQENKTFLKDRIEQAKKHGEEANHFRKLINEAKTRLERLRTERAMTALGQEAEDGPEELAEVREIDQLKASYKAQMDNLRHVKSDIASREHQIKALFEQQRVRQQREFEAWFSSLRRETTVSSMDDEKKRELYERITSGDSAQPAATSGGTPHNMSGGGSSSLTRIGGGTPQNANGGSTGRLRASSVTTPDAGGATKSNAAAVAAAAKSAGWTPNTTLTNTSRSPARHQTAQKPLPDVTMLQPQVQLKEQPPWARGAAVKDASHGLGDVGTGDADTDKDIAAYFAAIGSLARPTGGTH